MRDFGLGEQCPVCLLGVVLEEEPVESGIVRSFGEYKLLGELGRGGMGTVYRAEQERLARPVALKMLVGGVFAQPSFLERFRREALAAARLRHPGIAVVHDVGEAEGIAYYTMELLEGGSLEEWIGSKRCQPRAAAELLAKTARAVAFAHEHGVLHRDLKPSNILLSAEGEPKVADFGLALLVEEAEGERMTLTQSVLGTPAYMAPEVACGESAGISADVYSLGAILHEALTGQPPHVGPNLPAVLARARGANAIDPRKLDPALPADLATICRKCLDPEPPGRYPTAAALADDLARFLAGEPVLARPIGAAEQVWRWAKRNRSLAALALALLVSLVAGSGLVVRQATLNAHQAAELEREQLTVRRLGHEMSTHLYAADIRAASQEIGAGHSEGAWRWLQPYENDPARGIEWDWLSLQTRQQSGRVLYQGEAYVTALAFAPDGESLAGAAQNGALFLLDIGTGEWRHTATGVHWESAIYLSKGRAWYCRGGKLESRPVREDGSFGEPAAGPEARQVKLSADGRRAALCSAVSLFYQRGEGGSASVWDLETDRHVWNVPGTDVCRAAVNSNGTLLATAGRDGGVILWNAERQEEVRRWELPKICALNFSPGGQWLVAGGQDKAWLLAVDGTPAAHELRHSRGHQITEAVFSPDGGLVATACTDRVVRVWSTSAPEEAPVMLLGHQSEVWTLAWHPDGRQLVGGGRDGDVLLWEQEQLVDGNRFVPGRYQQAHFSPSGDTFVMAHGQYPDIRLRRWRSDDLAAVEEYPSYYLALGISAADEAMLWNLRYHRVERWPRGADEPEPLVSLPETRTDTMDQFALSADHRHIARLDNFGVLEIHPLAGNGPPRRAQVLEKPSGSRAWTVRCLAWSPDGTKLAAGTDQPPYHVWLVDTATLEVTPLPGPGDSVASVNFSPDGQWLASGDILGDILVWRMGESPSHEPAMRLSGHTRSATGVVFSPDSRTLLSLGPIDGVKFWHVETWRELAHLPISDAFSHLVISPDGSRLAVTCGEIPSPTRLRVFPLR